MALNSYTNLKAAIADWLNRSDLTTVIDDFIDAAEARFKRDAALWEEVKTTLSVSADSVALPDGFREPMDLYHDGGTYYGPIKIVNVAQIAEQRDNAGGGTGVPRFAAYVQDGGAVIFAPSPDTTYTLTIRFKRAIDALGASQATNWILTNHPDIYLYGALVESAPYLKDDARAAMWEARLKGAIEEVRLLKDRQRFGGKLVARPQRALGE